MGLDVYLYRYTRPVDEVLAIEAAASDAHTALWEQHCGGGAYNEIPESAKAAYRAACAEYDAAHGLNNGSSPHKQCIGIPSTKYPDHYFKVGYFRSSYNDNGINNVLRQRIGCCLYDIVGYNDGSPYEFAPDWKAVKERAMTALADFREFLTKEGTVSVTCEQFVIEPSVRSNKEALALFLAERAKPRDADFCAFSSSQGTFDFSRGPRALRAIIWGRSSIGLPCAYVVTESIGESAPCEGLDWYAQALEIVIETCDYVLAQPDRDAYRLHWSS